MENILAKKILIRIAKSINNDEMIDANYVEPFLGHRFEEASKTSRMMVKLAAALSFFFASILVIYPEVGEKLIDVLPGYFLLPERIANSLDFIWG